MPEFPPLLVTLSSLLIGYGLGSIPFGLLLTRAAGMGDVRAIGSGNIGATNVLRTGRKDIAAATLLLDALKGMAAVLICARFGQNSGVSAGILAGFAAFLGHIFPIWLKFKGGKGVATFVGCLFGLAWPAGVGFCVVWLIMAYASRYSSLAALIASAASPLFLWGFNMPWAAWTVMVMAIILWWKHAPNIARLQAGTEGRIGQKG